MGHEGLINMDVHAHRVVYCVVTEANLGIMSCRHDIMPDVVFILTDLNFTEFCV